MEDFNRLVESCCETKCGEGDRPLCAWQGISEEYCDFVYQTVMTYCASKLSGVEIKIKESEEELK